MKKTITLLLAVMMLFAFTACNNSGNEPTGPQITYEHDGTTEMLSYDYFTQGAADGTVTVEDDALKLATGNGIYFGTNASYKTIGIEAGNTYVLTYDVDTTNLNENKAWNVGYGIEGGTPVYDWMNSAVTKADGKKTVTVTIAVTEADDQFTFTVTGPLDNDAENVTGTGTNLLVCGGTNNFSIEEDGYVLISNIKIVETATATN